MNMSVLIAPVGAILGMAMRLHWFCRLGPQRMELYQDKEAADLKTDGIAIAQ